MAEYLTFEEYVAFGGTEDFQNSESEYSRIEMRARKLIDLYTFGRVSSMPEIPAEVKYLMFKLIDKIRADDKNAGVQSESLDKWSRTYSVKNTDERSRDYLSLISTYLSGVKGNDGTPLLYMGVDAL